MIRIAIALSVVLVGGTSSALPLSHTGAGFVFAKFVSLDSGGANTVRYRQLKPSFQINLDVVVDFDLMEVTGITVGTSPDYSFGGHDARPRPPITDYFPELGLGTRFEMTGTWEARTRNISAQSAPLVMVPGSKTAAQARFDIVEVQLWGSVVYDALIQGTVVNSGQTAAAVLATHVTHGFVDCNVRTQHCVADVRGYKTPETTYSQVYAIPGDAFGIPGHPDTSAMLSVGGGRYVPEPSTASLLALGFVALAWRRRAMMRG